MPSDIGTFASVLDPVSATGPLPAPVIERTASLHHAGRRLRLAARPIADHLGRVADLLRRVARAPALVLLGNRLVERREDLLLGASSSAMPFERMSIAMRASPAIVFTDVPPPTVPTVNVVFGSDGVVISPIFAIRAAHRVDRARCAERLEAVPARAGEAYFVAVARGADRRDAVPRAGLEADHAVDARHVLEHDLHAAQVAEALLADVGDEHEVADGLHLVVVEHLQPRQQHREAARVVGDARARTTCRPSP
jgi:hypothetical protein